MPEGVGGPPLGGGPGQAHVAAWSAVEPQLPTVLGRLGGEAQPHGRVGAVGGAPQQRSHGPAEHRQRRLDARGEGPARVHGVERDARLVPVPLLPLARQDDLGPLGPGVRERRAVVVERLQPCEVERLGVHAAGRHPDDAAVGVLQRRQQAVGERLRADDVQREGPFDPVGGLHPVREHRAGVVHEAVDGAVRIDDLGGDPSDLIEVGEVGQVHAHVGVGPAGEQPVAGVAALPRAAHDHPHGRPRAKECRRRGVAEPGIRPGHHDGAPLAGQVLERGPVVDVPPHPRADA